MTGTNRRKKHALFIANKIHSSLVFNMAKLEGNPFTYPEIKTLLDGVTVGGHKLSDQEQVLRISNGWKKLIQLIKQVCLRPRDRFWDIPVPKIDSAFDNLLVPQPSWSPSTTQQIRKLVAAPYLPPNDWTPRLDAYFASPLALCARRVSSAASRLLGSTSLRFALHGWQRWKAPLCR